MPIFIYSLIDVALLNMKWILEKKYNNELRINNPDAVNNLCHVDFILMEKNNILTYKD